ncbi:unnamed protein product [Prunus armeniaca]
MPYCKHCAKEKQGARGCHLAENTKTSREPQDFLFSYPCGNSKGLCSRKGSKFFNFAEASPHARPSLFAKGPNPSSLAAEQDQP